MPDEQQSAESGGLIRNPQDFFAGLVLIAISGIAFWAAWPLAGMDGFSFGAGTVPRLFASGLAFFGGLVVLQSFLADGPAMPRYYWRGPLFVVAAVVLFAVTVRPWGLVLSAFSTLVLTSIGTAEFRWLETIVWSAILTAFCVLVFAYALSLPLALWPR